MSCVGAYNDSSIVLYAMTEGNGAPPIDERINLSMIRSLSQADRFIASRRPTR